MSFADVPIQVILASGGFGADFARNSLVATYHPDLLHLPTMNGEHCTGDAIKMGEAIGAKTVDLECPGAPNRLGEARRPPMPKSSSSQRKRSAELVVLSSTHTETVSPMRLGSRNYATGEMWKNKPPFSLVSKRGCF